MSKREYRDRNGHLRECRLSPERLDAFHEDPMTQAYGVDTGEFVNDWRRQDLRAGCPWCRGEVEENLSEPDVLDRWGLGRVR